MSPSSTDFRATRRAHMADDVFDQLAVAILGGEMLPGALLPPERVLAEQFGTSRIIARQAIHRLAELGLLRVRQGGATLVLDPSEAGDLRLLELVYRLSPAAGVKAIDPRDILEKQVLQGMSLVSVAARRAPPGELAKVAAMASAFAASSQDEAAYVAFEERFWRALAKAAKNRIFQMEITWWYRVLGDRPRAERYVPSPLPARVAFYVELAKRLASGEAALLYYAEATAPLLDALARRPRRVSPRASSLSTTPLKMGKSQR